jgi:hypothetical protein
MRAALGDQGKELSQSRAKALDYYLGEVDEYLPAEEDRSSVVSRDVADTVEWILPSIIRMYVDADNAVIFSPQGQEDEDAAQQETDLVKHVFFDKNEGFLNLYTFLKDALLQKTGIFKCWWEEPEYEREEYVGLLPDQVLMMLNDPGISYEILDQTEYLSDEGIPLVDLTLKVARKAGCVKVGCVPPEEFGISAQASSPNPKKANFQFHRRKITVAELLEEGYDEKLVKSLPTEGEVDTEEELARSQLSGTDDDADSTHWTMRNVWISECYLKIDRNGDGIAELLCVKLAGASTGTGNLKLIEVEEVDSSYISAATPIILTHKFHGQSVADLVMDIADIRTTLLRGMLDNMYLANNGRTAVNEKVNLDDLLTSRPGGVVRIEGEEPPGNSLMPIMHQPVPGEAFGLLEVLDKILKQRTGVGDEVMGLDANALANVNTGVIAQAYDAARMRIEMIARVLAEVGIKEVFRDVHELLRKHQDIPMVAKLRNEWVQVSPAEWRERDDVKVTVGIGNHTRERKMLALNDIGQLQEKVFSGGGYGRLVNDQNLFNMLDDRVGAYGLDVTRYFQDPTKAPPPQKKPDPAEIMVQVEMQKLQVEMARLEMDREKMQLDAQIRVAESQSSEREAALKAEIEQVKAKLSYQKMAVDEQSQILNADTNRAEQAWREQQESMQLMLDKYKAELASSTTLEAKMMEIDQRQSEQMAKLAMELEALRAKFVSEQIYEQRELINGRNETSAGSGESSSGEDDA